MVHVMFDAFEILIMIGFLYSNLFMGNMVFQFGP